jgi:outer membrane murein-binding lipoprotein Lpp
MKRPLKQSAVLACALLAVFGSARGEDQVHTEVKDLRASVDHLRAEVALLRHALARLELERHRDRIQQMKEQLEAVRVQQVRLMELDRARQQDLRDLEELLKQGGVPAAERSDVEFTRVELAVAREREIVEQSNAVRFRESELVRRLETEEQAAKRLEEAWRLTGEKIQ